MGQLDLLTHYAPEEGGGDPSDYSDNRVLAGFDYDYDYDSRGRQTAAAEQFDTDGAAGFELVQSYAWSYDALGRLTAETFDLGADGSTTGDYATMYTWDLTDNRAAKLTQHDYSGPIAQMTADVTVTYAHDANGRLLPCTGQQYLRARWYDPSAGRFLAMDPYLGRASWTWAPCAGCCRGVCRRPIWSIAAARSR